ncbi:hypothetical protein Srufu_070200 [Streptomyces libani subsp. rufus]|nr:hypothetical protein Srufu_070200 [Streptomyces libani subsp. rufus]
MTSYANISGDYTITQSNSTWVRVHVEQTGRELSGYARFDTPQGEVHSESFSGTVSGEHVDFTIGWSQSSDGVKHTGHYWGDLLETFSHNRDGYLKGKGQDTCHPYNTATWQVDDKVFQRLV